MARSTSRVRSGLVGLLFVLACISITFSTIAVWAHQTLLVTDRFAAVTSRVVAEPSVQVAAADRLASEIITAVDVQGRIAGVLPTNQAFLAAPLTNAVEGVLDKKLTEFFATERAQAAFETAIRFTHAHLITLLRNDSDFVTLEGNTATIDLLPIAVEGLRTLQENGILPATIQLPDVTDPAGRDAAIAALSDRLGRPIPADFALIPIANADRLARAQAAVHYFDVIVVVLVLLTLAFILGTILLSGRRLRMVALLAIGAVVALLIARMLVRAALNGLVDSLAAGNGEAMRVMLVDLVNELASWSWILVILGIVIAIVAVLAGRPKWASSGVSAASSTRVPARADLPSGAKADEGGIGAWAKAHQEGLGWGIGIVLTSLVVWIALSPDLAILVGIGLVVVALTVGRRRSPAGAADADETVVIETPAPPTAPTPPTPAAGATPAS